MTQAFGLNDRDEVVGAYTDSAGNTDGMLALPQGWPWSWPGA